jgi:hypothetical protein
MFSLVLNLGGPYGNSVAISRLYVKSADNTILYTSFYISSIPNCVLFGILGIVQLAMQM